MERRSDIDILKGFSIIAIILFHIGILPYGYLGVDVFMVISGFLIIPPVIENLSKGGFHYFAWLWRRFKRFLPLVIIVCATSLIIGYFVMMPNDYENLAQSSFASELFANNILLSITTKNYWATANEYKPLLALWYLGILAQFFIIFPLVLIGFNKLCIRKSNKSPLIAALVILTIASFALYLLPSFEYNQKFYYLHFRIWEFGAGGCIFYLTHRNESNHKPLVYLLLTSILLITFSIHARSINAVEKTSIVGVNMIVSSYTLARMILPVTTVIISALLISQRFKMNRALNGLAYLGQMSLSLFIWHQLILAFMRYSIIDKLNIWWVSVYLTAVFIISLASYKWLEKIKIDTIYSKTLLGISWIAVLCASGFIYSRAGVVRDVPEMGVYLNNPYGIRNTEYIDRIYGYDRPFSSNKTRVLIIGYSFARDLACCLEQWDKNNTLQFSYMQWVRHIDRLRQADYVFIFGDKQDVPQQVWDNIRSDCKVYGIGTKYFGKTIGPTYIKRNTEGYFKTSIPVPQLLKETNDNWKTNWGDHYIDFVEASLNEKGEIRIFTPDSMIISFDCMHLTPAGAKYFSSRLGFDDIFGSHK